MFICSVTPMFSLRVLWTQLDKREITFVSIICFEGPSAVGKTTTADAFRADYEAFVVPEVNALFSRPEDEPADWYLERQVERYSIAQENNKANRTVILDGDPFQPLWYGWVYGYVTQQRLDFMEQFYGPRILAGTIAFPDLYIVFGTSENELGSRRKSDTSRRRVNFEKHLKIIEPQQRYFHAMNRFSPGRVQFLEAESVHRNLEFIRKSILRMNAYTVKEPSALFENITKWLKEYIA